jgi:hypothetical protein
MGGRSWYPGWRRQSRGKEGGAGGRGSADRWGHPVNVRRTKKRGAQRWAAAGVREMGRWAARLKGEKVRFFPFFLLKLFSNSNIFKLKIIQNFSNFYTKFCKPFKPHSSNQKPCIAKKIMHKHLLSLN